MNVFLGLRNIGTPAPMHEALPKEQNNVEGALQSLLDLRIAAIVDRNCGVATKPGTRATKTVTGGIRTMVLSALQSLFPRLDAAL
jgi:hypothetical protein